MGRPTQDPQKNLFKELRHNTLSRRVATYISKTIKYKRRLDLEMENGHMIVLDLMGPTKKRFFPV